MFFNLHKSEPLLDEPSVLWLLDVFQWAMRNVHLGDNIHRPVLIIPTNEHFPGNAENANAMAQLIFSQVKDYAGVSGLPFALQSDDASLALQDTGQLPSSQEHVFENTLPIAYSRTMLHDPEVFIASSVQQIAFHIIINSQESPPGGDENWPHAAEVLATFLGFGVIMANTANTQKIRSCGSGSGPGIQRSAFLSQYDLSYALAIFCILNDVRINEANRYLKKSLRRYFAKSIRELNKNKRLIEIKAEYNNLLPIALQENR